MKSKIKVPNKLSLGTETDLIFNDGDFCGNLIDNLRSPKTVRPTHRKQQTEVFLNKSPTTALYKFRRNQMLTSSQTSLSRCPSLTKSSKRLDYEQKTRSNNVSKEYLDIKKCQSEREIVPVQVLFEQNSFMAKNHEFLIDNITELSESIKVQLLNNHYDIQRCKEEKISGSVDTKMIFVLYNTLTQLDKKIFGSIFNEKQSSAENFQLKHLSDTMEICADMMTSIIQSICKIDTKLAQFLEYFWKFWVVLIDVAMQWMDKSCTDYIEYQIQQFKQQFEDAIHQKGQTEDKLIKAEKEFKIQEQMYQRKCDALQTQILSIQSEFNEYKQAVLQMSDLKQAEKRMNSVGLKALELENLFKQYDRQLFDQKQDFQKDFRQLGSVLVQQKKLQDETKLPHYIAQQTLHIQHYVENKQLYNLFINMHPFCLHFRKIDRIEDNEYDKNLMLFLDYLTTVEDLMQNVCVIFAEWINDPHILNCIVNHLLTQKDYTQHSLHNFYCTLFGLKNNQQLSWISVSNIVCYYKQIKQDLHITLLDQINCKESNYILDLVLPEEFMELLKGHKLESVTLLSLMNLLAQYLQQTENKQWNKWKYISKIESSDFDHVRMEYFYNLKEYLNRAELNAEQKSDFFDQIRHLSIQFPCFFYKHKQMISKMQMQVRRVSQKQSQQKDVRPSVMKRQSTFNSMIKSQIIRK